MKCSIKQQRIAPSNGLI